MRAAILTLALLPLVAACGSRQTPAHPPAAAAAQSPADEPDSTATKALAAPEVVGDSLCTSDETFQYGFDVPSRHAKVGVCTAETPDTTYVVYRFGAKDSVQLRFPARGQPWRYQFMRNGYQRPGGAANEGLDLRYLDFANNDVCYRVFSEWNAASDSTSVGIRIWLAGSRKPIEIAGANPRGSMATLFEREGFEHDRSCVPD
jgi:hypothetical protein